MPVTTIICSECKQILRAGDAGEGPEFKICPQCVIKTHPQSNKVNEVEQAVERGRTRFAAEEELKQIKKRFSKLNVELPYKVVDGEFRVMITLTDRFNHPFAEFGFSAEKLREIADDLDRLKEQADDIPTVGNDKT